MGSKSRISESILPIILNGRKDGQYYVEPFCGGCNIIDKVGGNRIAADSNRYLIAMWKHITQCGIDFPIVIDKELYAHYRDIYHKTKLLKPTLNDAMIGWVGFMGSRNGRFFEGGYSGHRVKDKGGNRDYIGESIRNIASQVDRLKGVCFISCDYKDLTVPPCSIIYCDPPYKGTTKYTCSIDYDEFWGWCREKVDEGHKVYVSEYNAPDDFECVWKKNLKTAINPWKTIKATDKLFIHKTQVK